MKFFKRFLRLDYIDYICDIFFRLLILTAFVAFAFICLSALLIENGVIVGYKDIGDLIYSCGIQFINGMTNDYLTRLEIRQVYFHCAFCWILPFWIIDTLFNFPYKKPDDIEDGDEK